MASAIKGDEVLGSVSFSSTSWQACSFTFTTGENGLGVTIKLSNSSGNAHFKNIVLTETVISYDAELKNGDFSDGFSSWDKTGNSNIVTDDGCYANVWWGGGNTLSQTLNLKPNTSYKVTFEGRLQVGHGNGANGMASAIKGDEVLGSTSFSSTEWQDCSFTFTTGEDGSGVTIKLSNSSGNAHFKNIVLTETVISCDTELKNGDFSDGFNGWDKTGNGNIANDDGCYANVWWGGGNTLSQTLNLKPNTSYKVTFEGRLGAGHGNGAKGMAAAIKGDEVLGSVSFSSTSWQGCSFTFTTGEDGFGITIKLSNSNGNAHFKNTVLTEITTVSDNLLVNGDFSDGSAKSAPGWSLDDGGVGARIADTDGSYYLEVWWGRTITQTVTLSPNTKYKLTFSGKKAASGLGSSVGIVTFGKGAEVLGQEIFADTAWTNYDFSFTTGDDATDLVLSIYASSVNIMVRNFYLYEDKEYITNGDLSDNAGGVVNGWNLGENGAFRTDSGNYLEIWGEVTQTVDLEPNRKYLLKFTAKRTGTDGKGIVQVNDALGTELVKGEIIGDEFANYVLKFEVGDNADGVVITLNREGEAKLNIKDLSVKIYRVSEGGTVEGAAVITDFGSNRLYAYSDAVNIFDEGGFEAEPESGWNTDDFIGNDILIVSDEKSRSGEKSLKVTIDSTTEQSATMWVEVEPEHEYVLQLSLLGEFMCESNLADAAIKLIDENTGKFIDTGYTTKKGITPTRWDNQWHRRAVAFTTGYCEKIGICITGKSASLYIDDVVLCDISSTTNVPQQADKKVDKLLAAADHIDATLLDYSTDIVKCDASANLISNSDFELNDDSWKELIDTGLFKFTTDYKDASNRILQYSNNRPGNYNIVKWLTLEKNTKYAAYIRIRGDVEGDVAFTVVTASKSDPKRLIKYTPERWDGVWQTYSITFNTFEDAKIGIGFIDGGGQISIDSILLCKYEDASFEEAPPLPPLPGEETDTPSAPTQEEEENYDTENVVSSDDTVNEFENVSETNSENSETASSDKKGTKKGKTVYNTIEVTDWVAVGAIIGGCILGAAALTVLIIIIAKKRKKRKLNS